MTTNGDADPLVGRVLDDRYELTRRIGQGGMAVIYLATDRRLSRTVAVKIMHETYGGDSGFVTRFEREATAAARLSHPNVVSVFDRGVDDNRPYIVMEYVEGPTLRRVMSREGAMPPTRMLELITPVIAAVAAAHEAGIVHRDLKPENVFISTRGQIKVGDFGLARAVSAQTNTSIGTLIGTVSYIAPELVTTGKGDTRADIYALGIMMYEMLTGRKPHTGDNPVQIAYSHVHNPMEPPSRAATDRVPDYVDALVTAAAAREPGRRPADATALLENVRLVGDALNRGVANDPDLAARLQDETDGAAEARTELLATRGNHTAVLPVHALTTPSRAITPTAPSEPGAKLRARRARRRKRGLVALIAVLLFAVLAGWGVWYYVDGRFVDVPAFKSLTQAGAKELADTTKLTITFTPEYSEEVPKGEVIDTDPQEGTPILLGGAVTARVSLGPERYAVPKLVGKTLDAAKKDLANAHLAPPNTNSVYDDKAKSGVVVKASMKAGTMVPPGTTIDLDVSKGPQPVAVIDYTGKPLKDAQTFFETAGLTVKVSKSVFSDSVPKDAIISQDPTDGTVPRGGTVTVVVSKGPELVEVPNVRRLSVDEAKKKLTSAGFKWKIEQRGPFSSLALGTSPGSGKMAVKGSTVTLLVG